MSIYDTYVKELKDVQAYTESDHFDIVEYLDKVYDLYKNGNFLVINLIGSCAKLMAEKLKDDSYYKLALAIYQAGPTKVLDLDFSDQMEFLLHKGEFLAEYAREIDSSYKEMAMETLNEYGNMSNDGRHLKAKAYLEKPEDENDTLNMEIFKERLLEYFSFGNELSEEELDLVGIPSPYLSMEKEQLVELVKQYKKDPEELKKIYPVLLFKGETRYAIDLEKINKQFLADYYLNKKDPFYRYKAKDLALDSASTSRSAKKVHRGFFAVNLLLVVVDIFCSVYPNYSLSALFNRESGIASVWVPLFIVALFASILVPILSFLFAKKGKINLLFGILFMILGLETAICGVGQFQFEAISYQIVLLILTGIFFLISGILAFKNSSRKEAK